MKNAIHFFSMIAVCTFLGFSTTAQAQQKIAHVDSDLIISEMPEYKKAKSDVEAYSKVLQKQLEDEQAKIGDYYNSIVAKAEELSPIKQKEEEAKLKKMQEDLQQMAMDADQKLAQKEADLTKPLYEKYNAAIQTVAKANGYAYIIDKKLAIYSESGSDVTELVKAELGL